MDEAKSFYTLANGDRSIANNVVLLVTGGKATKYLGERTTSDSKEIFENKTIELKERGKLFKRSL
jgi:hypothetical protein